MVRASSPEGPHQPLSPGESEVAVRDRDRGRAVAAGGLLLRGVRKALRQSREFMGDLASPRGRQALRAELRALSRGVAAAPALLRACVRNECSPWYWVERWARLRPSERAIADEFGELSWAELKQAAQTLRERLALGGVRLRETTVVLLAENSIFSVVALLAIQRAGGSPLLLSLESDSELLPLAIQRTGAKLVLVERERHLAKITAVSAIQCVAAESLPAPTSGEQTVGPRRVPSGGRCFAVLMTSGTTALPKVVSITHQRAVLSGYGMGVMCLGHGASDTIYCVLPLVHATGLMTALCPALVTGCGLALRRRFSATEFWRDARAQQATSAIYVGEIARRLISTPPSEDDAGHGVTTLYGNGMPLDAWHRIQARFAVRRVVEFYGATELPLAMVNLAGVPGHIGRIALRQVSPWQIARLNTETGDPQQEDGGSLTACAEGEPGELVLMDRQRTGDIVVRDANGYVRYCDRQPGLFRQNGHNVSSRAVEAVLHATTGVEALGVTHVQLPRYDGQAGLLVVVPRQGFELRDLEKTYQRLPKPQRPRFVRLTNSLRLNRGLKFDGSAYRHAGVDPEQLTDPLYVYCRSGFVPIDSFVWQQLQLGTFRF